MNSITIKGYEIPMASRSRLLGWACWCLIPVSLSLALGEYWFSLGYAVFIISFFHLRNVVVRAEVASGIHDPLYGKHLQRTRQRQYDNDPRVKRLTIEMVSLFIVSVLVALIFNT